MLTVALIHARRWHNCAGGVLACMQDTCRRCMFWHVRHLRAASKEHMCCVNGRQACGLSNGSIAWEYYATYEHLGHHLEAAMCLYIAFMASRSYQDRHSTQTSCISAHKYHAQTCCCMPHACTVSCQTLKSAACHTMKMHVYACDGITTAMVSGCNEDAYVMQSGA